jgi:transposase
MPQTGSVVGLDVSGRRIDACILPAGVKLGVTNDAEGHQALIAVLRKERVKRAACEASGGCERAVVRALRKAGVAARVTDPGCVRHFAKAAGQRAKNDVIDARVIAEFTLAVPKPAQEGDPEREELGDLVSARQGCIEVGTKLSNQVRYKADSARSAMLGPLAASKCAVAELDRDIATRIVANERFARVAAIVSSVPGVGPVLTAALIAWLPELGHLSRQEIASLVGVAPIEDRSGDRQGDRHIAGGRKRLRGVIYMAVMGSATKHNPVLRAMYARLIAKGKKPKVAIVACMRKLLHILNTMVARQQTWDPPSRDRAA